MTDHELVDRRLTQIRSWVDTSRDPLFRDERFLLKLFDEASARIARQTAEIARLEELVEGTADLEAEVCAQLVEQHSDEHPFAIAEIIRGRKKT